jgi:cytochrome c oxidase assembly protein subunit 15
VTGSGPHAGDATAHRTGFDPATVAQLHADAVMLLIGLTVATGLGLRATGAPAEVRAAARVLLGLELAQGLIGYLQYFTGVPAALVGIHLLGACLVWLAALRVLLAMRVRSAPPAATPVAEKPATSSAREPARPTTPALT